MSNIQVSDLGHAGSEFFQDSENFLDDLNDVNTASVYGGQGQFFENYVGYGIKTLEYGILGYGINNIVSLTLNFSNLGEGVGNNGDNGAGGGVGGAAVGL